MRDCKLKADSIMILQINSFHSKNTT